MTGLLQIRNVPDDTRRALKSRAAAQGRSLNEYLLEVLVKDAAHPTVGEVLDRAAARIEGAGSAIDGAEVVRQEREEREAELMGRIGR